MKGRRVVVGGEGVYVTGVKGRRVVVGGEGVYVTGVKGRDGRVDRGVRGEGWAGWMRDVKGRGGEGG